MYPQETFFGQTGSRRSFIGFALTLSLVPLEKEHLILPQEYFWLRSDCIGPGERRVSGHFLESDNEREKEKRKKKREAPTAGVIGNVKVFCSPPIPIPTTRG
jgi:hypothetical protein